MAGHGQCRGQHTHSSSPKTLIYLPESRGAIKVFAIARAMLHATYNKGTGHRTRTPHMLPYLNFRLAIKSLVRPTVLLCSTATGGSTPQEAHRHAT